MFMVYVHVYVLCLFCVFGPVFGVHVLFFSILHFASVIC